MLRSYCDYNSQTELIDADPVISRARLDPRDLQRHSPQGIAVTDWTFQTSDWTFQTSGWTFSGASGGTLGRSITVIMAFCARLEKLLLRVE